MIGHPSLTFPSFEKYAGLRRGTLHFTAQSKTAPKDINRLFNRYLTERFDMAQREMSRALGNPIKLRFQSWPGYDRLDDAYYARISYKDQYLPLLGSVLPRLTPLMFLRMLDRTTRLHYPKGKSTTPGLYSHLTLPLVPMYRWPASVGLRMSMVKPQLAEHRYMPYDYMDSYYYYPALSLEEEKQIQVLKHKIRGASCKSIAPEVAFKPDIEADYKRWASR